MNPLEGDPLLEVERAEPGVDTRRFQVAVLRQRIDEAHRLRPQVSDGPAQILEGPLHSRRFPNLPHRLRLPPRRKLHDAPVDGAGGFYYVAQPLLDGPLISVAEPGLRLAHCLQTARA